MALTLHVCPGDSSAVVWASGDVDTNMAEVFRDMMLRVMRRHSPSLLLDLSGVSFMDCAGLRALLLTQRLAEMRGGSVCLIAESPAVHRIIDLSACVTFSRFASGSPSSAPSCSACSAEPNCTTTGPSSGPRGSGRACGWPVNLSGLWMCDGSADRQSGRYQCPARQDA